LALIFYQVDSEENCSQGLASSWFQDQADIEVDSFSMALPA